MDEAGGQEKLISELISHINRLDSRLASFEEKLSESEDLQLLNKLDLINLNNEIEKVKLVLPSISEEQFETFRRLLSYLETTEAKTLIETGPPKNQAKDMKHLGQRLSSLEQNQSPEGIGKEIEEIKSKLISLESHPAGDTSDLRALIKQNKNQIDQFRQRLEETIGKFENQMKYSPSPITKTASISPKIKELEIALSNLKLDVQALEKKPLRPEPPGMKGLHRVLSQLQTDVERLKAKPAQPQPVIKTPSADPKIKELQIAVSNLKTDIKALEKKSLPTAAPTKAKDLEFLDPLAGKVASLKKDMEQLSDDLAVLRSTAAEKQSLAVLQKTMKERSSVASSARSNEEMRSLARANQELHAAVETLKKNLGRVSGDVTILKSSSHEKQLSILRNQVTELKQQAVKPAVPEAVPEDVKSLARSNRELQITINLLKKQILTLQQSSSLQEKKIQTVATSLPQMRKAIGETQALAVRSAEKTKKETADYILRELKRTVA